jgi:dolichol-phosphate mannosyltransferase
VPVGKRTERIKAETALNASTARIVLALPAYNEAENIDALFGRVAAARNSLLPHLSILIYNDGSKDDTAAKAQAWHGREGLAVRVIGSSINKGLGGALLELVKDFCGPESGGQPGAEAMALMDCDNTMDPFQLPEMWETLSSGALDVVIASRYARGAAMSGVPALRRLMSRGASVLFTMMHPIPGVRDYSCGFRLYRREPLAQALHAWGDELIVQRGFASMVELLLKLGRRKLRMAEVPLQLRYDQKLGESKMPVGDNAVRLLKMMWRWRMEGLDVPPPGGRH